MKFSRSFHSSEQLLAPAQYLAPALSTFVFKFCLAFFRSLYIRNYVNILLEGKTRGYGVELSEHIFDSCMRTGHGNHIKLSNSLSFQGPADLHTSSHSIK